MLFFSLISVIVIPIAAYIPASRFITRIKTEDKVQHTELFLSTADFKNGMTMELDGVPYKLLEFLHVKPGKGSAFVRTKVKNLVSGTTQERTFRAGESISSADISKIDMQFLYNEADNVVFMNMETFEEQRIPNQRISNLQLLKEGLSCIVTCWNEEVIELNLPQQVSYKVVECPPNFKGNTAQGAMKPATLDSGAVVQVPMFIEEGDNIIVSTEDAKYVGKDSK